MVYVRIIPIIIKTTLPLALTIITATQKTTGVYAIIQQITDIKKSAIYAIPFGQKKNIPSLLTRTSLLQEIAILPN